MGARPQQTHWLRENALSRSPHRLLVVDTETLIPDDADPDRQVLRLWCATLIRRHGIDRRAPRREHFRGHTTAELVTLIGRLARSDHALWIVTHNLAFDLAVTELPVRLAEAGWRITEAALTTDSPWCRLARRSHRLTIADSWSWLPTSVAWLGKLVGIPKVALPERDDPEGAWWERCETDVAIVARALGSAMDWWDEHELGNWSLTGPATGWSSYRHRKPRPRVLVVPDDELRALELRAVTGGRREVRRLGELPAGSYADLDLATAHLTAMAGLALPMRRLDRFDSLALDHHALDSTIEDVLAEAELETTSPRYPWSGPGGLWFPVGRFRTLLAGPELREARARGELRSIGPGVRYIMTPHMADWALWLAGLLDEANPEVPPSVRLLAKHWSRCVPGRWAGHTSEIVERTPDPRPGWQVESLYLMPERRPADLLRIGGERWTILRDEWADDAFPAILAWIQSATRVAIGRLVDMLGPAVLTVNTDGALVDLAELGRLEGPAAMADIGRAGPTLRALDAWCAATDPILEPFTVRIKKAARRVTIYSPQHVILDGERRLSGIPKRAVRLADGRYSFTTWPNLRVQIERTEGAGYRTVERKVAVKVVPPPAWLLLDGRTVPVRVMPDSDDPSRDRIVPTLPDAEHLLAPIDQQHPGLRKVMSA